MAAATRGCPRPQPLPPKLLAGEPEWLAKAPSWLLRGAAGAEATGAAERLREALRRWLDGRTCAICGTRAQHVAGAWLLEHSGRRGRAVLEALVPLCGGCRLSYWPGEAAQRGLLVEARRRYRGACGGDTLVEEALRLEAKLAEVEAWEPRLAALEALGLLGGGDVAALEAAAGRLAAPPWVPGWDTVTALGSLVDEAALGAVADWLGEACATGLRVAAERARKTAERLHLSSAPVGLARLAEKLAAANLCSLGPASALEMLEGYWAARLEPGEAERLVADPPMGGGFSRLELPLRGPLVARLWTPVALDAEAAAEALSLLEEALGRPLEAVYRHAATSLVLYTAP